MAKQKYYYVTGNTAQGFVNYLSTNMKGMNRVIVLKHPSHTLKTAILRQLLHQLDADEQTEIICSPYGNEYIEGIIVRGRSLAILSDTVITPSVKISRIIELSRSFPYRHHTLTIPTMQINEYREKSYKKLAEALKVHDELEAIYIQEMNFNKANELSDAFIQNVLNNVLKQQQNPHIYERLFGTNTDQGPVNIVPQMIAPIENRVYIKGRAGTGKSVFMKKIIKACLDHHFDVEQYHCSFDANSIDMLIVPGLDLCVFDSTSPHEFAPERKKDIVIDLYKETVTKGTDEKYAKAINNITRKYKAILTEGIEDLKQAKYWQDQIENPYGKLDHKQLTSITRNILKDIK